MSTRDSALPRNNERARPRSLRYKSSPEWRRIPRKFRLTGSRLQHRSDKRQKAKQKGGLKLKKSKSIAATRLSRRRLKPRCQKVEAPDASAPRSEFPAWSDEWWDEEHLAPEDEWKDFATAWEMEYAFASGIFGEENKAYLAPLNESVDTPANTLMNAPLNTPTGHPLDTPSNTSRVAFANKADSRKVVLGAVLREAYQYPSALHSSQTCFWDATELLRTSQSYCARNAAFHPNPPPGLTHPSLQSALDNELDTSVFQEQCLDDLLAQDAPTRVHPTRKTRRRRNAMSLHTPPAHLQQSPTLCLALSSSTLEERRNDAEKSTRPRAGRIWESVHRLLYGDPHRTTGCRSRGYGFSHPALLAERRVCYEERGEECVVDGAGAREEG